MNPENKDNYVMETFTFLQKVSVVDKANPDWQHKELIVYDASEETKTAAASDASVTKTGS